MCTSTVSHFVYDHRFTLVHDHDFTLTSKISIEGWWMVTMTVRPFRATFRTALITVVAARASSPEPGLRGVKRRGGQV